MKATNLAAATDVSFYLTLLATMPYELGQISVVLPPKMKEWIATVGFFATVVLAILKRHQERKEAK